MKCNYKIFLVVFVHVLQIIIEKFSMVQDRCVEIMRIKTSVFSAMGEKNYIAL